MNYDPSDPSEGDIGEREYVRITGIVHLRIAKQQAAETVSSWGYYYPEHAATIMQAIKLLSTPLDFFDGIEDADEEDEDEEAYEAGQARARARVDALLGTKTAGAAASPTDAPG